MDIIHTRKGDCSEHSQLFTALARAVGIPCRTVGGLIYLGDEFLEFGLHAWNEVAIGGIWVPVDPTWGQVAIDATHIRFSVDISKEWQVMAALPKMKITVLSVAHQNQTASHQAAGRFKEGVTNHFRTQACSFAINSSGSIFHPIHARHVSEKFSQGAHSVLPPTALIIMHRSLKLTIPFNR